MLVRVSRPSRCHLRAKSFDTNTIHLEKYPRARNDYDEETAYESYMNPEPGFKSGPGDSVDAD